MPWFGAVNNVPVDLDDLQEQRSLMRLQFPARSNLSVHPERETAV